MKHMKLYGSLFVYRFDYIKNNSLIKDKFSHIYFIFPQKG